LTLQYLAIEGFRCLSQASLELDEARSYIFGPNAAGKTSLLEAVYFLGRGRSFRTRDAKTLVPWGEQQLILRGTVDYEADRQRLATSVIDGRREWRLNGEPSKAMDLAGALPVLVIDPTIHRLIEGGPDGRRKFLDWGVFHVEPNYLDTWRRYRRALGQRNAALKADGSAAIPAWDHELAAAGVALDGYRAAYLERLNQHLSSIGQRLLGLELHCAYRRGWGQEIDLGAALAKARQKDLERGRTGVGPHRAELRVLLEGGLVREQASRGQQKLVAAALTLAQTALLADRLERRPLLLVDDPAAELANPLLDRFLAELWEAPAQLLITGLDPAVLPTDPGHPVFHVEQGEVRRVV
jgi:DNA replication and repair protein RecF